jgi:hypothetical protein
MKTTLTRLFIPIRTLASVTEDDQNYDIRRMCANTTRQNTECKHRRLGRFGCRPRSMETNSNTQHHTQHVRIVERETTKGRKSGESQAKKQLLSLTKESDKLYFYFYYYYRNYYYYNNNFYCFYFYNNK